MRAEDFEFLYNLEERYWWFVAMRRITDTIMRKQLEHGGLRVLDAGCGTGFNLRHYQDAGHHVYGLDIARDAVDGVKRRGFSRVSQASVTEIPYRSNAFDIVFSFDVICQVPAGTDVQAISEMCRVLKPGGFIFVRVPAFEWLRSSHDAELDTTHRFTRGELRRKLEEAGFDVHLATYANTLLFPVAMVRRFLKHAGVGKGTDVKPLPAGLVWVDPVFQKVLALEAAVFGRNAAMPFGLSVICYAQKPH